MSRRIDRDDLVNPTVLGHDNIGNDWHVRLGTVAGKPFTFVTPTEAAEIAAAWASIAFVLAAREEWSVERVDALVGHLTNEISLASPNAYRHLAAEAWPTSTPSDGGAS